MVEQITEQDIIESLTRSGYLLESQIVYQLASSSFFVEPNQVLLDPDTGKSREIDIIAEYVDFERLANFDGAMKFQFVIEVINNIFPLVLLTEYTTSPNMAIYEGFRHISMSKGNFIKEMDDMVNQVIENLENSAVKNLFTQYASLHKTKDKQKLVASHSEDLYSSIKKSVQYCDEAVDLWSNNPLNDYNRFFIYLPIIIVARDLYTLTINENHEPVLAKVNEVNLVHNYHKNNELKMAVVNVITKDGLESFLNRYTLLQQNMCEKFPLR